jgi:hypothetical protein
MWLCEGCRVDGHALCRRDQAIAYVNVRHYKVEEKPGDNVFHWLWLPRLRPYVHVCVDEENTKPARCMLKRSDGSLQHWSLTDGWKLFMWRSIGLRPEGTLYRCHVIGQIRHVPMLSTKILVWLDHIDTQKVDVLLDHRACHGVDHGLTVAGDCDRA